MQNQILLAVLLALLVAGVTAGIIFSPTAIGRFLLDYSAVGAGLFFIIEGGLTIWFNRQQSFARQLPRLFRIFIGLAMLAIHALRILPVPTKELLKDLL